MQSLRMSIFQGKKIKLKIKAMLSQTIAKEKVCLDVPNLNFKKIKFEWSDNNSSCDNTVYCFDCNFLSQFPKTNKNKP